MLQEAGGRRQERGDAGGLRRHRHHAWLALSVVLTAGACDESSVAPTETAPSANRVVFVSSMMFTGAIGGVSAADQACADLATAVGLAGSYRAWLSDAAGRLPASGFTRGDAPFVMTSGVRVADHWADLTDGTINNPIVIDERGTQPDSLPVVWTGTDPSGQPAASGANCRGWTDAASDVNGQVGVFDAIGTGWTAAPPVACDQPGRIYCFQQ